jgi:Flp pilus assembly protein TadG
MSHTEMRALFAKLHAYRKANQGVAAIEFALVLPFLLILCFGGMELMDGVTLDRQVSLVATSVDNIVSQYTSISASTQMPDILNASVQIMQPYTTSNAGIVVSLITIGSSGQATVSWSQALNATARTTGSTVTVPSALDTPNTTLVLSEASYAYTPVFDFIHTGTLHLFHSIYMVPREATTINLTT